MKITKAWEYKLYNSTHSQKLHLRLLQFFKSVEVKDEKQRAPHFSIQAYRNDNLISKKTIKT